MEHVTVEMGLPEIAAKVTSWEKEKRKATLQTHTHTHTRKHILILEANSEQKI